MSREQFTRTQRLLGETAMERLRRARVAVFGIGGVGGFAAEALARSGVGTLDLIDSDVVCESNLNRQIIAAHSTLGRYKTEVMRERILDINPDAAVHVHNCFFLPENAAKFPFEEYDYVVDAVDTVTAKLELVLRAKRFHTPIISCMGAGNKLDPTKFQVADIYETRVCPLAKVMRRELKKRGVESLKVVYSEEPPAVPDSAAERKEEPPAQAQEAGREFCAGRELSAQQKGRSLGGEAASEPSAPPEKERTAEIGGVLQPLTRRSTPGSVAFVPSVAGLILAGEVVKDIAQGRGRL